eukprot:SAG31_NODE_4589_length_3107_cov_2.071120_3_plen_75_part_00
MNLGEREAEPAPPDLALRFLRRGRATAAGRKGPLRPPAGARRARKEVKGEETAPPGCAGGGAPPLWSTSPGTDC